MTCWHAKVSPSVSEPSTEINNLWMFEQQVKQLLYFNSCSVWGFFVVCIAYPSKLWGLGYF